MFIYLSLLERGRNNRWEVKDKCSGGSKGYGHRKRNQAFKGNNAANYHFPEIQFHSILPGSSFQDESNFQINLIGVKLFTGLTQT